MLYSSMIQTPKNQIQSPSVLLSRIWQLRFVSGPLKKILGGLLWIWWLFIHRRDIREANQLHPYVKEIFEKQIPGSSEKMRTNLLKTDSGTTITICTVPNDETGFVLKVACSEDGYVGLKRQTSIMKMLNEHPNLGDWRRLIPHIALEKEGDGQYFVIEQKLPGIIGYDILHDPKAVSSALEAAVSAIIDLQKLTATTVTVDEALLDQWITQPLGYIREMLVRMSLEDTYAAVLDRLSSEFHEALLGHTMVLSWGHGDYYFGNFLVNQEANQITGIIDWEQASPQRIPLQDIVHLLVSTRMDVHKMEIGTCFLQLLDDDNWTESEQVLRNQVDHADAISTRHILLITWLHHIAANLKKGAYYSRHWLWFKNNIENVLNAV